MSLPSGYTQCEYIQSTGVQYIETGCVPSPNTRVVIDFECSNASDDEFYVFGCCSSTSRSIYGVSYNGTNSRWYTHYNSSTYKSGLYPSYKKGNRYVVDLNKNIVTVEGNTANITTSVGTWSSTYPMYLFARNKGGTASGGGSIDEYASEKIYSCRIYEDDVLIRDFVPCVNPSGVVGLWDSVNSEFYTSPNGRGFYTKRIDTGTLGSHRTLIGGTGYSLKKGRILINGTGYDIKQGRTLIDGTGYSINFETKRLYISDQEVMSGTDAYSSSAHVKYNDYIRFTDTLGSYYNYLSVDGYRTLKLKVKPYCSGNNPNKDYARIVILSISAGYLYNNYSDSDVLYSFKFPAYNNTDILEYEIDISNFASEIQTVGFEVSKNSGYTSRIDLYEAYFEE